MRGLKSRDYYYPALIAALIALFHLFYTSGKVPYPFINIVFLLWAPAGYFSPLSVSCGLGALSWIVLFPLFAIFYRIDAISAAAPIAVFNILVAAFALYRNSAKAEEFYWDAKLRREEASKGAAQAEFEKLRRFESGIIEKEISLINIYELTKRMSASLRFEEIFEVLGSFLKENFEFARCELAILKGPEDAAHVERIYSVSKKDPPTAEGVVSDYGTLISMFREGRKEISASRTDRETFRRLRLDKTIETFMAIPLFSEKKLVGALSITDLPREDTEKFAILAVQFALETKKVLLYETVELLAITDGLTGLYVRRYFFERLNEELDRSRRHKFKLAFLMADIDDFKVCNDTYGHLVGDVVLKEMGRIMKENVREIDLVARYGGEEFSLVLPETGREGAALAAERIRKKIEEHLFRAYDEKLKVTISVGAAVYPDDATEVKDLVEKADKALYEAKRAGKNIIYTYSK